MKKIKEYVVICLITLCTLAMALLIVRKYFPKAAGITTDMQMVKVAKTLPPFFKGIFRDEKASDFFLLDPTLGIRAQSFIGRTRLGQVGPHDAFGFRNLNIPIFADIVVFGDSQTYGSNAPLELNWPSLLAEQLAHDCVMYNMAVGGWGPAQYLAMARYALKFRPSLFIVAFYSGNDALDAFRMAYNFDEFKDLRLFPEMSATDLQDVVLQRGTKPVWRAILNQSEKLILQPDIRYLANSHSSKVAMAGWKIMAECARRIGVIAARNHSKVVFTVIPTKELCFYGYLQKKRVALDPVYLKLVHDEKENIAGLKNYLALNHCGVYVDLIPALQELVLTKKNIYPSYADGHPLTAGYRGIANTLFPAITALLPLKLPDGLYYAKSGNKQACYFLVQNGGVWPIKNAQSVKKLGFNAAHAVQIDTSRLDRLRWQETTEENGQE